MKCDETKPICLRCVRLATLCSFIKVENGSPGINQPAMSRMRALQPRGKVALACPALSGSSTISTFLTPSTRRFDSTLEYQYFDLFCKKTSFEILPAFDSDVLRQMLMQACQNEASVRHAVIALGALHKNAEDAGGMANPTLRARGWRVGSAHQQDALSQYSKAIMYMRKSLVSGQQDIRTTLLTSFTIIVFEACLGNDRAVVEQIQTGLSILRNWKAKYPNPGKHTLSFSSPAPVVVEADLVRAFGRLEVQSLSTLDENLLGALEHVSIHARVQKTGEEEVLASGTESILNMPKEFTSIAKAHRYLEIILKCSIILKRLYSIIRSSSYEGVSSPYLDPTTKIDSDSVTRVLVTYQATLSRGLAQWSSRFEELVHSTPNPEIDSTQVSMLRLHSKMARIALHTALTLDQSVFEKHQAEFEDIIYLSGLLVKESKVGAVGTLGFTSDLGIIIPLWLTGVKCRVRYIRQLAITILHAYARQEGAWNSELAAQMIAWAVELEERYLDEGVIPMWARIQGILWSFGTEPKTAHLVCRQRLCAESEEMVMLRKKISW